MTGSVLYSWL
uniref:Uncharacterized protein n=1 Tax=Arundo donax TaxID=35708 RepID=A0A0A8ZUQ8_ARUDO